MTSAEREELQRLWNEKRELAVDKKSIEVQLLAESASATERGQDWRDRAKFAVARTDKRLAAINTRMAQIDPSGTIRGHLGRITRASVVLDCASAFDAARVVNERIERGERVLAFQVIDGKLVMLTEWSE